MSCDEMIGSMTVEEAAQKIHDLGLGTDVLVLGRKSIMLNNLHVEESQEVDMMSMGKTVLREVAPEPVKTFKRDYPKVGNNAPCPCKSGLKFKHCCKARAMGLTPRPKPEGVEDDPVIEKMFRAAGK